MGMFGDLAELREQEQTRPAPPPAGRPKPKKRPNPKPVEPVVVTPAPSPPLLAETVPTPPSPAPADPAATLASVALDLAGLPEAVFDLAEHPYAQANFLFLTEELERLDDLKLELRRAYGVAATKNAIIRCALHLLVEDYERHKAHSFVVRRLPKRQ